MVSEELMTQMANKVVRADVAQRVARASAQQRVDDAVRVRGQHGDVLTTPAAVHWKLASRRRLSGYTDAHRGIHITEVCGPMYTAMRTGA